jgi:hypothetical protein
MLLSSIYISKEGYTHMATDIPDFLSGFSAEDFDLDLGIQFVDEQPSETIASTATAAAEEVAGVVSNDLVDVNTKIDQLQRTLSGIQALLDFDDINIEGKLDVILEKLGDIPSEVTATTPEAAPATVVDMTPIETKVDHLIQEQYQILEAIGDPKERKAEIERRLQKAIDDNKAALDEKLADIEKLTLPLLFNLIKPESLTQKYIFWPNRKEIIERQIKRIVNITRPDQPIT